jgi:hypothetical protein
MIKNINIYICAILLTFSVSSCESYLDKAPDSTLDKSAVFQDFAHAQGFLEQCYGHVVNYSANIEWDAAGFLLGDETLPSKAEYKADWNWELGSINLYNQGNNYLYGKNGNSDITNDLSMNRGGIWQGWKAIRIANIVIEELKSPDFKGNMTSAEKDLLMGQALFFRAFFHSEIMKYWGRIPYIDKVLTGNDKDYAIPRPKTYKECALRADQDYAAAAALLPENWDDLQGLIDNKTIHSTTFGNSRRRINRAIVYSFKGRNLLYAASPLMHCTDTGKGIDTYAYDQELAEMAAKDLAKVIDMDKRDVLNLGLADKNTLLYCFTTKPGQSDYFPGTPEALGVANQCEYIFSATAEVPWATAMLANSYMPYGSTNIITPNHRFINRNFGTANGLSLKEDPTYNPQNEFTNRDPRFYSNLIIDGDMIIQKATALPKYKYAQCYSAGILRGSAVSKYSTGYFIKKYAVITANTRQLGNTEIDAQAGRQWWMNMRLTDVYLMYAEAMAATTKYGPSNRPDFDGVKLSALDVLNIFRDRYSMPHVETSYQTIGVNIAGDAKRFMDVLRRERAVEMCFEGYRWDDIRRWMVAQLDDYKTKTALDFDRNTYDVTKSQRGQFVNINFRERVLINRICDFPKHFWLPFNQNEVTMYEGVDQNPGW